MGWRTQRCFQYWSASCFICSYPGNARKATCNCSFISKGIHMPILTEEICELEMLKPPQVWKHMKSSCCLTAVERTWLFSVNEIHWCECTNKHSEQQIKSNNKEPGFLSAQQRSDRKNTGRVQCLFLQCVCSVLWGWFKQCVQLLKESTASPLPSGPARLPKHSTRMAAQLPRVGMLT